MVFKVKHNIRDVDRSIRDDFRNQVPFAAALALTHVAKETRFRIIKRIYPKAFRKTANKSFPRALYRFERATKRNLNSRIIQVLDRQYMTLHQKGGMRRAHKGGRIAVPVGVSRLKSGRISKTKRPDTLKGAFKADHGRGEGIWTRDRKGKLRLHYVLKRVVRIRRSYPLERQGYRYAERIWPRAFDRGIKRALRTARR